MGEHVNILTLELLHDLAQARSLAVFGAFHPEPENGTPVGTGTLILFGPAEPGFWQIFTDSKEYLDGQADPLDRWSQRVVGGLAQQIDGQAIYPFGGPPFAPFIQWATQSGRAWSSPVGLLVHETAGLLVSYRGAIALKQRLPLPALPEPPCVTCSDKPCLTACPAGALTGDGYDLPGCHSYLDSGAGQSCMQSGCAVRHACPISKSYGRLPAQSALHMKAFHQ